MSFAFRNLVLPAVLLAGIGAHADTEAEWYNTTSRPFRIVFLKFEKAAGKLTFKDDSGVVATWDKSTPDGTELAWPALKKFRVNYSGTTSANANFRVRMVDSNGKWVDFLVNNPRFTSPTLKMDGAAAGVEEKEGDGFKTEGLKGGFRLNNKGFWSVKHDGTNF
jgi:hypothetical protein